VTVASNELTCVQVEVASEIEHKNDHKLPDSKLLMRPTNENSTRNVDCRTNRCNSTF